MPVAAASVLQSGAAPLAPAVALPPVLLEPPLLAAPPDVAPPLAFAPPLAVPPLAMPPVAFEPPLADEPPLPLATPPAPPVRSIPCSQAESQITLRLSTWQPPAATSAKTIASQATLRGMFSADPPSNTKRPSIPDFPGAAQAA